MIHKKIVTPEEAQQRLWKIYQQTIFVVSQPLPNWSEFAVITAYNPRGTILPEALNLQAESQLQTLLQQQRLPSVKLLGASEDLSYAEPSWMISINKNAALKLGKQFQQNAIYYISADQLWLLPCCLHHQQETMIGSWQQRLHLSE